MIYNQKPGVNHVNVVLQSGYSYSNYILVNHYRVPTSGRPSPRFFLYGRDVLYMVTQEQTILYKKNSVALYYSRFISLNDLDIFDGCLDIDGQS